MQKATMVIAILVVGAVAGYGASSLFGSSSTPSQPEPSQAQTTDTQRNEQKPNENTTMSGELQAGSYQVNTDESEMTWTGRKTLIKDYEDTGTLSVQNGTVQISDDGGVSGEFTFDMTSIAAASTGKGEGQDSLSRHLKSEDFFAVEEYPTAEFVIIDAEPFEQERGATHQITGELTVKGITNEVSFPASITRDGDNLVAKATTEIDRTKWNVRYGSDKFFDNLADNVIDDNFTLAFSVVAEQS